VRQYVVRQCAAVRQYVVRQCGSVRHCVRQCVRQCAALSSNAVVR
jgi:hypothetical protein